ncbi:MAG: methyltransferase domain-containing protein [Bacteroidota bacterium]
MSEINKHHWNESYWSDRYKTGQIQWDTGSITTPLKEYFDQLTDKNIKILIPGCGNGYEPEYLWNNDFKNVFVVDLSKEPLANLELRLPEFPNAQLLQGDFFDLEDTFDLIVEQTFFCSLNPSQRPSYASKMNRLLKPGGKLIGLLFDDELFKDHPPFGGNKEEYLSYFKPFFKTKVFERSYNSIKPRRDRELFINLEKG